MNENRARILITIADKIEADEKVSIETCHAIRDEADKAYADYVDGRWNEADGYGAHKIDSDQLWKVWRSARCANPELIAMALRLIASK